MSIIFSGAPALFQSEDLNTKTRDFHHFSAAVHSSQSGPSYKLLHC